MTIMTKISLFKVIMVVVFLAAAFPASAQGEWKWAHHWTGGDGSYGDYYNKIINTAFDDDGNIYVYGTMGGSPKYDENTQEIKNLVIATDSLNTEIADICNDIFGMLNLRIE